MVSDKKIFISFSHYKTTGVHDLVERGQFSPHGLDWQDLCRGPINIATYEIYKPWASWFHRRRTEKIFQVFPIMSLWELDHVMVAILIYEL